MGLFHSGGASIAAPLPVLRLFYRLCPHRVQNDVSAHFKEIALFLYQDRHVPALEDMTDSMVFPVEVLRIDPV